MRAPTGVSIALPLPWRLRRRERPATADEATKYIDEWAQLPAGVDTKAPLSDFYDAETLEALKTAPDTIQRWASRNTAVIGKPDSTAAAAKSPHRKRWSCR